MVCFTGGISDRGSGLPRPFGEHLVCCRFSGGNDREFSAWITLFLVVSCVLVALLWPFIKKFLRPKLEKTNLDAIIGTEGYVTTAIDNVAATGQVKLGAMEWTARSTSGSSIPEGTLVKVDRIEGVKVFVSVKEAIVHV